MPRSAQNRPMDQDSLSEKGRMRRELVLKEAKRVLLQEGLESLVLRKVASSVDIKLGHLQYYFPTRDDLLEAVFRDAWDQDEAIILEAGTPDDMRTVLSSLLEAWAGERGKLYLMLAARAQYDARFERLKKEIYISFYDDIVDLLAASHPRKSRETLLARAKVITSIIDGAMLQIHSGDAADQAAQRESLYSDLVDLAVSVANR